MAKKKEEKQGTEKLGAIFKKFKAAFNITAAAQGAATYPVPMDAGEKFRIAIARYTGLYVPERGTPDFNIDRALETYKGILTEIGVQYVDTKTNHYGNISKHELLDIVEEALPILMSHEDAKGSRNYLTNAARAYHKYTQGYDMHGAEWGTWDLDTAKPYLTVKTIRVVGNKTGIIPWLNRHLPKGLNI